MFLNLVSGIRSGWDQVPWWASGDSCGELLLFLHLVSGIKAGWDQLRA